jgi:regulator of cell morphogenesis and NO signaling
MRHEHDQHGEEARALEVLAHGFEAPEDACNSWRALYSGLDKFAGDLAEHIHLENNVLFPRFERAGGRA